MILLANMTSAQELPPRPMKVTKHLDLNFGAFINGSGVGTVTITAEGARSSTGDIYLVNMGVPYNAAIFRVEALPGNIIQVIFPPIINIAGSNGGIAILKIDSSFPTSPFINSINPPFYTEVKIGGTLTVTGAPAGIYHGDFSITFIQE